MCECSYSWKPPVICGIILALGLIPLGIDKTWESFGPNAPGPPEKPPPAPVTGSTPAPPWSANSAIKYEGPLMIGVGLLCFILGIGLGIRAFYKEKDINQRARERHARELREMEEGPPPECMLVVKKEAPAESSPDCSPAASILGSSRATPENPSPVEALPLKDLAKRSLLHTDSVTNSDKRADNVATEKTVPLKEIARRPGDKGHSNKDVPNRYAERKTVTDSPKTKHEACGTSRWGGGITRREDLLPGEIPIPLSTPPLYRVTEDGGYWMTSFSDLSTVGEESSCGVDNRGFDFSDENLSGTWRNTKNVHSKDRKLDSENQVSRGLEFESASPGNFSSSKRSSNVEVPTRGNVKSTSRGNASSNKDRQHYAHKSKETSSPRVLRYESKVTGAQRRKRKESSSIGDTYIPIQYKYADEQLRSSTSEQLNYEQLVRHRVVAERQSDSTYRDSEGDSAYFTHGPEDLSDMERPSAPGPTHKRNASRERTKTKQQKRLPKPRHWSESSSGNADYYSDPKYHLNAADDAVFLDSPNTSRRNHQRMVGYDPERAYLPQRSDSGPGDYRERSRTMGPPKTNISDLDSPRHRPEVHKGIVISAADLKHHQRSLSGSYVPRTSRSRDRDRLRRSEGHRPHSLTLADRVNKTQTLPQTSHPRHRDLIREYGGHYREDPATFENNFDARQRGPPKRERLPDRDRRRHGSPTHGRRGRVRSDGASPLTKHRSRTKKDYSRQRSTTSDIIHYTSRKYDGEISA